MEEDRLISPALSDDDTSYDSSLRPKNFDEYIGQGKVKDNLSIFIEAAKGRSDAADVNNTAVRRFRNKFS